MEGKRLSFPIITGLALPQGSTSPNLLDVFGCHNTKHEERENVNECLTDFKHHKYTSKT